MYEDHLMDKNKLVEFFQMMYRQLEKHKDEKTGIKNWEPVKAFELCRDEIRKRIEIIATSSPDETQKQSIHIANYCFFLWQKMTELNQSGRSI